MVKALVDGHANVNSVAPDASTPLLQAVRGGDRELVEILIKAGADTNHAGANGETSLHLAARRGDAEIAFLLVDAGGDVNTRPTRRANGRSCSRSKKTTRTWRASTRARATPLFSARELRTRDRAAAPR